MPIMYTWESEVALLALNGLNTLDMKLYTWTHVTCNMWFGVDMMNDIGNEIVNNIFIVTLDDIKWQYQVSSNIDEPSFLASV